MLEICHCGREPSVSGIPLYNVMSVWPDIYHGGREPSVSGIPLCNVMSVWPDIYHGGREPSVSGIPLCNVMSVWPAPICHTHEIHLKCWFVLAHIIIKIRIMITLKI